MQKKAEMKLKSGALIGVSIGALCVLMCLCLCLLASTGHVAAQTAVPAELESRNTASAASVLLEKYAALDKQLGKTAFGRPLVLESFEDTGRVNGNAYAVLDASWGTVSATFKDSNRWCDVMILHINTKYCRATSEA